MDEEQLLNSTSKRTRRNKNTIKYGMFGLSLGERNYNRLNEYCLKHNLYKACLLYTSPSPRDGLLSRMPSSA